MKVSTERLPESQIKLEIEVEDERLQKAVKSAYKRLASKAKIPGFRPGKVPQHVLERHLGEDVILHEAIDRLMPEVYQEALEQEEIDPVDRAEYELVTEQPLVAQFTVPVRPSVDLRDYTSVRLPTESVEVDEKRVQEGLESLRHRYATLEPVSRPIQWGDIVRADVHGTLGGKVLVKEEDAEFQLLEDRPIPLPGFAEGLIGQEKDVQFEFEATVPDDAPDEAMRGQQVSYEVTVKEVKEEVLPDLDDDFARQAGEGFSDLAALRTRVEDDLRQALENDAKMRYQDKVLEELVERAEIEYPPVLVDREVERLLEEQSGIGQTKASQKARASREQLDRYLERAGKTEEELLVELRPVATERIRRSLVLSEVTEAEHIEVNDSEVEAEVGRMTSGVGDQADEVRRLFSNENAKESLRRSLLTKKTLERLVQIASADGAAAEEAEAGAPSTES